MVVECMGRNAGFIALSSAVAGGADVCVLPELNWDYGSICAKLRENAASTRGYSLVVVSEGARLPGTGKQVVQASGNLGGVGYQIAKVFFFYFFSLFFFL